MPNRALLLASLLVTSTGCYHIRYITHHAAEHHAASEQWHHDLFYGLWEVSAPVDVSKSCPGGISRVEEQVTFPNFLAWAGSQVAASQVLDLAFTKSGLSSRVPFPWNAVLPRAPVDIWSPETVTVTCAQVDE